MQSPSSDKPKPEDLCLGDALVSETLLQRLCDLSQRQVIEVLMTALYDMQGQSQNLTVVICRALGMKPDDQNYWREPEVKPKKESDA